MSNAAKRPSSRRMGRPTEEQSRQLDERIVSTALEMFLEQGYEGVTLDALAQEVGITKRTLYLRYKDKSDIFLAAFDKSKGEWAFDGIESFPKKQQSLEAKLLLLAEAFLQQALNPRYIRLGRMAVSQTFNYPGQIEFTYETAASPRLQSVVAVLKSHRDELDECWLKKPEMTAELFIGLITGYPARLASMGTIRDVKSEMKRIKLAVKMFEKGISKPR